VTGPHIYVTVPTIFYLQNLPVPSDMNGKVLTNILWMKEFNLSGQTTIT